MKIAETIRQQIGNRALMMLGAKDLLGSETERYLQFRVGRNAKGVTHIHVALAPQDTYTVSALRIRCKRGEMVPAIEILETMEDVYWDRLRAVLERLTGMYTSV